MTMRDDFVDLSLPDRMTFLEYLEKYKDHPAEHESICSAPPTLETISLQPSSSLKDSREDDDIASRNAARRNTTAPSQVSFNSLMLRRTKSAKSALEEEDSEAGTISTMSSEPSVIEDDLKQIKATIQWARTTLRELNFRLDFKSTRAESFSMDEGGAKPLQDLTQHVPATSADENQDCLQAKRVAEDDSLSANRQNGTYPSVLVGSKSPLLDEILDPGKVFKITTSSTDVLCQSSEEATTDLSAEEDATPNWYFEDHDTYIVAKRSNRMTTLPPEKLCTTRIMPQDDDFKASSADTPKSENQPNVSEPAFGEATELGRKTFDDEAPSLGSDEGEEQTVEDLEEVLLGSFSEESSCASEESDQLTYTIEWMDAKLPVNERASLFYAFDKMIDYLDPEGAKIMKDWEDMTIEASIYDEEIRFDHGVPFLPCCGSSPLANYDLDDEGHASPNDSLQRRLLHSQESLLGSEDSESHPDSELLLGDGLEYEPSPRKMSSQGQRETDFV